MDLDSVVESTHRLVLDHLPIRTTKTPSGWITFDCPMCNDKRKRAGVITKAAKLSYHCFNCGYTTGWSPAPYIGQKYKELAARLGAGDDEIHKVQIELLKYKEELEEAEDTDYVYNFSKFEIVELPENVMLIDDLPDDHEVKQYARQRGLEGLYTLLYFPDDPLYAKRLVVPFTFNGDIVGWTARHINPPDKKTPKYLHKMSSGFVFNIDRFADSEREIVIVVEGVFDAIGVDGVSVLGNHVTPEQAHLIEKLGKRVILCPDRDKAGKELIEEALALGWEVSFPPWHKDVKDAADAVNKYGRLATVASIIKHATDNKIKAQVKAKML
jgi:hypothetical protein